MKVKQFVSGAASMNQMGSFPSQDQRGYQAYVRKPAQLNHNSVWEQMVVFPLGSGCLFVMVQEGAGTNCSFTGVSCGSLRRQSLFIKNLKQTAE